MTATRPPFVVIHLIAVCVLLLSKPILVVGMLAGTIFAWLASVIVTVENSVAPQIMGASASLLAAAPCLRTLYRRVIAFESREIDA